MDIAIPVYSPVYKKGGTQEVRFKFWLCLELPMTLNKAFDFPGSLVPSPGNKRACSPRSLLLFNNSHIFISF